MHTKNVPQHLVRQNIRRIHTRCDVITRIHNSTRDTAMAPRRNGVEYEGSEKRDGVVGGEGERERSPAD